MFIVVLQMNTSKVNYLLLDLSFLQKAYKNHPSACSTGKLKDLSLFFKSCIHSKKGITKRVFQFCSLSILILLTINSKSKIKINTY